MSDFVKKIISDARFETYRNLSRVLNDRRTPEELYALNIAYSKEFYGILSGLEIAIRNVFHGALSAKYGTEKWFDKVFLRDKHQAQLKEAREKLERKDKRIHIADDLIAQLNFGFWVRLCDSPYEKTLWINGLHRCFPRLGRPPDRESIREQFMQCLKLRNDIAHLEPIIKREDLLIQDYRTIRQILYAISPEAEKYFSALSSFEEIWNNRLIGGIPS